MKVGATASPQPAVKQVAAKTDRTVTGRRNVERTSLVKCSHHRRSEPLTARTIPQPQCCRLDQRLAPRSAAAAPSRRAENGNRPRNRPRRRLVHLAARTDRRTPGGFAPLRPRHRRIASFLTAPLCPPADRPWQEMSWKAGSRERARYKLWVRRQAHDGEPFGGALGFAGLDD